MTLRKLRHWLVACLVAATSAVAQAQPVELRIQDIAGISGSLARVAIEKGYCAKQGLKCTLNMIPQAPLGIQTLMAGGIEVSATPSDVLVQSAARGSDVQIVSGTFHDNPFFLVLGTEMMAEADKGYPAVIKALKGKKIGVSVRGTSLEFQFKAMLKDAGMGDDDVTFVVVGPPATAYAALINKHVDAAMGFAPFDGMCEVLKTCRVAVWPARGQGPKSLIALNGGGGGYYVMRKAFIAKNPGVNAAFLKAMQDAQNFATNPANLEELLKITLKYYRLELPKGDEILLTSLKNNQSAFVADIKQGALQAAADFLHQTGQMPQAFDVRSVY